MTEIDVPVIGGPWLPAKDFFEKVQGAINNSHGHENKNVLDNITDEVFEAVGEAIENKHTHENKNVLDNITDEVFEGVGEAIENKHIHENKEYLDTLSERPTATISIRSNDLLWIDIVYGALLCTASESIPVGTELKTIRIKYNDVMLDIKDMTSIDDIPYVLSMNKVYLSFANGVKVLASIGFIQEDNAVIEAAKNSAVDEIEVEYYV